ncbi:uncharacterized protein A4U43_C08F8200 [Asparagus officinalis]|uniref:uncharacterized protein LOC109820386 isoform X2 n=1 Tax=Asparagus officinalis TaxID=4686 RepID=UPI00098E073F|nr:uncharacterized protein LOC109820386 isoform X2 [Asparagus officinalis]ONK59606.1 uncharacterized protein A4U43_C08F8200 [Asparagus officinalis]
MKPTVLSMASLLILFLLLVETPQGIRFEEESLAVFHKIIYKESFKGEGGEAKVVCKEDEACSGRIRKLMMTKAMATSKKEENSEKGVDHHSMDKNTDKNKKPEDFHVQPPESYSDVLDIVGMDYSPARRKSPIHN